jgi:hypothetical protein
MRNPLRALYTILAALAIGGCNDGLSPLISSDANTLFAANGSVTGDVQFLPPLVANTSTPDVEYDLTSVPVAGLYPGQSCAGTPVITFSTTSDGSTRLKIGSSDAYNGTWQTKGANLATGGRPDYRLCVHVEDDLRGWIDIDVVRSSAEFKDVPWGSVGLVVDAPLVISFRLLRVEGPPPVGDPAALVFTQQPANSTAGGPISVSIEVRDANGAVVTTATGNVVVALTPNAGPVGAVLEGTTSVAVVNGVATFSDLSLTLAGASYSLDAAFGALTATSNAFDVSAGAAALMTVVAGEGQSALVNTAVPIAPAVEIVDAWGNPVVGLEVTFTVASGGGSVTGGVVTTDSSGRATVGSWVLGPNMGPNTLLASANGVSSVAITAFGMLF